MGETQLIEQSTTSLVEDSLGAERYVAMLGHYGVEPLTHAETVVIDSAVFLDHARATGQPIDAEESEIWQASVDILLVPGRESPEPRHAALYGLMAHLISMRKSGQLLAAAKTL